MDRQLAITILTDALHLSGNQTVQAVPDSDNSAAKISKLIKELRYWNWIDRLPENKPKRPAPQVSFVFTDLNSMGAAAQTLYDQAESFTQGGDRSLAVTAITSEGRRALRDLKKRAISRKLLKKCLSESIKAALTKVLFGPFASVWEFIKKLWSD